ncbi:MAG: hypothetical protein NVS3B1_06500 [Marmoricola sp.]
MPDTQVPLGVSANASTSLLPLPPVSVVSSQRIALTPIRTIVVSSGRALTRPPKTVRGARTVFCPSFTHEGHWNPTAAGTMQSGQMGRPQRWQLIQVCRPGWR